MNNTRAIALTAVCSAMATVCFVGGTYVELFGFVLCVLGGVLVCVPMMVTPRYRVYTLISLVASATITTIVATSRIVELVYYCASIVPLVVIKVWCDRVTLDVDTQDNADNTTSNPAQTTPTKPKRNIAKWVAYYIWTQISIAGIILVTYLLLSSEWDTIVDSYLLYVMVALLELVPIALDKVLNGVLRIVMSAMVKAKLVP